MNRIPILLILMFTLSAHVQAALSSDAVKTNDIPVTEGETLRVECKHGEIRISPWDSPGVQIKAFNIAESPEEYSVEKKDGSVWLRYQPAKNHYAQNTRFEIKVPRRFNLAIRTAGGTISITDALQGNAELHTAGGNISMTKLEGTLNAQTAGGNINVGVVSGKAHLATAGGDIELGHAKSETSIQSAGGDIYIRRVEKPTRVKTAGGNIRLGRADTDVELETLGGDVSVDTLHGKAHLKTMGGDVRIHSATGSVHAHTSGGSIRAANISGSIEAHTMGGDIDADLTVKAGGNSKLYTNYGDITLRINANAKATINATAGNSFGSDDDDSNIISEFPASGTEQHGNSKRYTLNGGGHTIDLHTTIGEISIRKNK